MPESRTLQPCITFGDFTIDRADERLIGPQGPVRIGNKAFQVLLLLADRESRLLTKDALFSSVWDGMAISESSLTSVIKELRRALGDDSRTPRYIESVYGRGYRLIPPVTGAAAYAHASVERPGAAPFAPTGEAAAARGQPPLVIVSAFHDEAVRERHPYCAEELREEVFSGLSRVREIQLVADEGGPRHDGAERGYRLTATLLPHRDSVKVIARVKRLGDGLVLWAETMPLGGDGTAEGVETIVRRILGAALPAVDEDVLAGLPREPGDVYDAYLVAKRRSFTAATPDEARSARDALEHIIARRPDFALAYPPLVRLYHTDFGWTALGSTGPEERAKALLLAKRGLAADRGNAHAHSVLGWCYIWHDERALARRSFDHALDLNPYNRIRVQEAATALTYLGDFERAQELLARSLELNPMPDDDFCEDQGRLKLARGDYEGARAALQEVARGSIWADLYLGACDVALGGSEGPERIARWRDRVERNWHGGRTPDRQELIAWVRRHHPLPDAASHAFFTPVERGLAA